jgi:hypothetical protein
MHGIVNKNIRRDQGRRVTEVLNLAVSTISSSCPVRFAMAFSNKLKWVGKKIDS